MSAPDKPDNDEGGFLSRWSRLKRQPLPDVPAVPAIEASEPAEPDDRPRDPETGELIDAELVARLPRIDELQAGGDLSAFMNKGVPEALRREALRTMWLNDPMIRNYVSPALDYAYDYNAPGGAPGYGPLTESDMANAREFLANVFSTPQKAPESVETDDKSGNRDNRSHVVAEVMPEALRLSDGAAQHEAESAVTTADAHDIRKPADTSVLPQSAEVAVVQRNMKSDPDPAPVQLRKRRGGGAAPV